MVQYNEGHFEFVSAEKAVALISQIVLSVTEDGKVPIGSYLMLHKVLGDPV